METFVLILELIGTVAFAASGAIIAIRKKMDIFGGWEDYEQRLETNWKALVEPEDTIVVAGDISWCMDMEEGLEDFRFLDSLPGTKIILKGNHDYWWATKKKADEFFAKHSLGTLNILHNNAYECGNIAICGTRGWFFDAEDDADKKIVLREAGRLRMSIAEAKKTGKEPVVFLHYPPITQDRKCDEIYAPSSSTMPTTANTSTTTPSSAAAPAPTRPPPLSPATSLKCPSPSGSPQNS